MARLLLVEDDHRCREPLRMLIEMRSEHKVATATNGREALDWIAANGEPGVILLDLYMPVMDGFEFLQVYKGKTPVIVVSAWADVNEDLHLLRVVAALRKPVSSVDLLSTIDRVLKENQKCVTV
jgi:CheY-like chemotaxis protein